MLNWFKRRAETGKSYSTNEEWVEALTSPPEEDAVKQLRESLIRGLKPALHKYVDRELNQFVEDVAQDALLKILDNIESFRGESKFITWSMKIAVREGLSELRRKKWNDISIDDLSGGDESDESGEINTLVFSSQDQGPDRLTHEGMLLEKVLNIIENELSPKQKQAITAVMIRGISPTVVAEQMEIKRNALYKLIHDARLNLKKRLEAEGINPDEILNKL